MKDKNGRDLPGWPRFARDTVWSSPAAADLNGDGVNEMIIGIDAHNEPAFGDKEGSYVLALRGDNTMLPGWPKFQDDAVFSSPAVADLDDDGKPEIIIGSGNFYAGDRKTPRLVTPSRRIALMALSCSKSVPMARSAMRQLLVMSTVMDNWML